MKKQPVKEVRFKHEVWVNPTTESLRLTECLCLNCYEGPNGDPKAHCYIADTLYQLCRTRHIALAVTRCPNWKII